MTGIIITGVARGGTSLIAGVCDGIGVPMGKGAPRFENPYLQWAVLAERWDVVALLVNAIEEERLIWGWKLPVLHRHLPIVSTIVTNPRFIFVLKDAVSVARRRCDPSDAKQFAKWIDRSARAQRMMATFAATTKFPTLFVSYEEFIRDAAAGVEAVARFCSVEVPHVGAVVEQLRVNHQTYLGGAYVPRVRTELDARLSRICTEAGVKAPASPVS